MTNQSKNTQPLNVHSMAPALFRKMLVIAILGFTAIWGIDNLSGNIAPFDAAAYPICVSAFVLTYLLSTATKLNHQSLHFFSYFIVAGYLISSSIWHHSSGNGLFSNSAQWLGLNYVIAYLFLDAKKAAPTTLLVFAVTIVGHYLILIQHYTLSDTLGVVLNMAIAHMIYIFLLWTVIKLRIKTDQVTERADMLENYAYVDLLTRVLNRRGIDKVYKELSLDSRERQNHYSIMMIDIDHFKQINDQHGHIVGDKVLSRLAAEFNRSIDPNDVLGRWGGEEFILLTLGKTPEQVIDLAENLRSAVNNLVIDELIKVTISIGIGFDYEAESREAVFNLADQRLYGAKQAGRNTVCASSI